MINSYNFGSICIDDHDYSADVIIFPERVTSPWWRAQGHNLTTDDLAEVLKSPPDILVIGTGYYGRMKVPRDTLRALQENGIELRVSDTRKAVEEFNRLQQRSAAVVAALHLTC
jgi:hypothetical protein